MSLTVLNNSPTAGRVCATCNYSAPTHNPQLLKCTNVETKYPPFEHPIILVHGNDRACDKHWEKHPVFEDKTRLVAPENGDADQTILKLGATALLVLFVLAIFRDKLGDVFPALKTLLPWFFRP